MADEQPTQNPDQGQPQRPVRADPYPIVLSQRRAGDDLVYVEFALPGLRRATVAVPYSTWIVGGHLVIGAELAGVLDDWNSPV